MSKKLTTEEFVKRAREVHSTRFDYALVEYADYRTPVTVICRIHGPILQNPSSHLAGKVPQCCSPSRPRPAEEKIRELRQIHSARYTYDPTSLINTKQRVRAICKQHGPFTVSYYKHRLGAGCPECSGNYQHQAGMYFLKRARAVHGQKFQYGKYNGAARKMRILCPRHGAFRQSPASHFQGHGCPRCANDRKKFLAKGGYSEEFFTLHPEMRQHPATFYVIEFRSGEELFLKVGVTRTSVKSRYKSGYRKYCWRLMAVRTLSLYSAFQLEQELLRVFCVFHVYPRQHEFVGKTECLAPVCADHVLSWLAAHDDLGTTENQRQLPATSPNRIPST